jgi:DNA-binding transcriptional MerR regulator
MSEEYTLEDLENMSGLSLRTLRFYIQEGLLPGPDTRGKFARYSQNHLNTIHFIDRLKKVHMPLKQIRHLLETMSNEDIERIIQSQTGGNIIFSSPQLFIEEDNSGKLKGDQNKSSALEYIRSLENLQGSLKVNESNTRYYAPPAPSRVPASLKEAPTIQPVKDGETWQRIHLADGLELQVREPIGKEQEQVVTELIEITNKLFSKINKKGEK